jgi:hypothetical protein
MQEELDLLAGELRQLHGEIAAYTANNDWWPTKPADWAASVWRYDSVLCTTAELLGIPIPPRPPQDATRRLSPPERAKLERLLAGAGINVAEQ